VYIIGSTKNLSVRVNLLSQSTNWHGRCHALSQAYYRCARHVESVLSIVWPLLDHSRASVAVGPLASNEMCERRDSEPGGRRGEAKKIPLDNSGRVSSVLDALC
jgi:hypothetical protein